MTTLTNLSNVPLSGGYLATEPQTREALEGRILYNVTPLVNELLGFTQRESLRMEEYPNMYEFDWYASAENSTEPIEEQRQTSSDPDIDRGYRDKEVLEWWLVERGLMELMREAGLVVMEAGGLTLWGRTTSGQAWSLDGELQALVGAMQQRQAQLWREEQGRAEELRQQGAQKAIAEAKAVLEGVLDGQPQESDEDDEQEGDDHAWETKAAAMEQKAEALFRVQLAEAIAANQPIRAIKAIHDFAYSLGEAAEVLENGYRDDARENDDEGRADFYEGKDAAFGQITNNLSGLCGKLGYNIA